MFHGARRVLLLGSHEFEPWIEPLEREALARATGDGSVLITPTAAFADLDAEASFGRWARKGLLHYDRMGVPAHVVELRRRDDAFRPGIAQLVARASMVFFSGGSPAYLADVVCGSPVAEALTGALERGAVVAGCSAGSCVLGALAPRSVTGDLERDDVWSRALELFPEAVFVPHWDTIDDHRMGLRDVMTRRFPERTVVGIDERTALAILDGGPVVFGEGSVHLIAGGTVRSYPAGARIEAEIPASSSEDAA